MRYSQPYPIKKSSLVTFEEVLGKENNNFISYLIRFFLFLPSLFYALTIKVRNFLFDRGFYKSSCVKGCVISVGNIVAGGSGKTPFILLLAKRLAPYGRIAILTRGYGRVAPKGEKEQIIKEGDLPEEVGDEPLFLFSQIKEAIVIVGANRVASARRAEQMGARFILLDDGMQHRRLHRDVEIVLTGENEIKASYLPAGVLRDDPRRLKVASIVATQGRGDSLKKWTDAPVIEVRSQIKGCFFADGKTCDPKKIKAALFCGIARPKRFVKSVYEAGVQEIVAAKFVGDHKKIGRADLEEFARNAKGKGADTLLCTEKDAIKYRQEELMALALPVAWLKIESVITKNEEAFSEMIDLIRRKKL